jgi:hypothetical protein
MQTFSKIGFAGIRLGVLFGANDWIELLDRVRMPYNVNSLTQATAAFAIDHWEHFQLIIDEIVVEYIEYAIMAAFAKAILSGEITVKAVPDLKRVFRLHPPRGPKGWGGIKRSYVVGGALGSRGEAIGALVERMI